MEFLCFVASYVRSIPFIRCERVECAILCVCICVSVCCCCFFFRIYFFFLFFFLFVSFLSFGLCRALEYYFSVDNRTKRLLYQSVWNIKSQQNVVVAKISVFRQWNGFYFRLATSFLMFRIRISNSFYPARGQSSVKKFILSFDLNNNNSVNKRNDSIPLFVLFDSQRGKKKKHRLWNLFGWHRHWNELKINLW